MVFYVVRKLSSSTAAKERYGPFESKARAEAEASKLGTASEKRNPGEYQVVCDFA
jgi:hypothetical protein